MRQYHGASLEIFEDKQLMRQVYEEGGQIRLRQIGYFAESDADAVAFCDAI